MPIRCIDCGQSELVNKKIQLSGEVRDETYTVSIDGLECPICGYKTIDGSSMQEFKRLLADKYRSAHGLLTSAQIKGRRQALGMSQDAFAEYLRVGIASVKRWEMGKIQEKIYNDLIVAKTGPARPIANVTMRKSNPSGMIVIASTPICGWHSSFRIAGSGLPQGVNQLIRDAARHEFTTDFSEAYKPGSGTEVAPYLAAKLNEERKYNGRA